MWQTGHNITTKAGDVIKIKVMTLALLAIINRSKNEIALLKELFYK